MGTAIVYDTDSAWFDNGNPGIIQYRGMTLAHKGGHRVGNCFFFCFFFLVAATWFVEPLGTGVMIPFDTAWWVVAFVRADGLGDDCDAVFDEGE